MTGLQLFWCNVLFLKMACVQSPIFIWGKDIMKIPVRPKEQKRRRRIQSLASKILVIHVTLRETGIQGFVVNVHLLNLHCLLSNSRKCVSISKLTKNRHQLSSTIYLMSYYCTICLFVTRYC